MFEFAAENWETKCSASSEVYVKVKVCGAAFSIESREREREKVSDHHELTAVVAVCVSLTLLGISWKVFPLPCSGRLKF